MDSNKYADDLDEAKASVKKLQVVAIALAAAILLCLILMLNLLGRDRTVVSPPTIEKSFWVTSDSASDSYVQQMTQWISSLILDVTPDNIEYKSNILLQYVHPDLHGKLKERQTLLAQSMKKDNVATYFVLSTIRTQPEKLAALITGRFHTLINGNHVGDQEKSFFVRFMMDGGRAQLIEFTETQNADLAKLLNEPNAH
jgi:conjugal transfer pilus assembly protein TraE